MVCTTGIYRIYLHILRHCVDPRFRTGGDYYRINFYYKSRCDVSTLRLLWEQKLDLRTKLQRDENKRYQGKCLRIVFFKLHRQNCFSHWNDIMKDNVCYLESLSTLKKYFNLSESDTIIKIIIFSNKLPIFLSLASL